LCVSGGETRGLQIFRDPFRWNGTAREINFFGKPSKADSDKAKFFASSG
jgi:hypothetical protein